MLALVCSNDGSDPAQLREVEEPRPASNEALVEVEAMAINRGELHLLATRPEADDLGPGSSAFSYMNPASHPPSARIFA